MMRLAFLFLLVSCATQILQAQVKMEYTFGFPTIRLINEKPQTLTSKNAKSIFTKDFKLTTKESEYIKLIINNDYELNIFDNTDLDFMLIRDEMSTKKETERELQAYKINMNFGQVLIKRLDQGAKSITVPKDLRIESDFFQWDLIDKKRSSLELMISLNPSVPQVRFCNARPEYTVKLYDHEKEAKLKAFEEITFVGVLEKERVAYDLLLQGKKIPKGSWDKAKACSFSELTEKETAFRLQQEQRRREESASADNRRKLKMENDARFLCHKPYGQFNDCWWKTESQICVRYRCNADGKWSARTEMTRNQFEMCDSKQPVSKCNY